MQNQIIDLGNFRFENQRDIKGIVDDIARGTRPPRSLDLMFYEPEDKRAVRVMVSRFDESLPGSQTFFGARISHYHAHGIIVASYHDLSRYKLDGTRKDKMVWKSKVRATGVHPLDDSGHLHLYHADEIADIMHKGLGNRNGHISPEQFRNILNVSLAAYLARAQYVAERHGSNVLFMPRYSG